MCIQLVCVCVCGGITVLLCQEKAIGAKQFCVFVPPPGVFPIPFVFPLPLEGKFFLADGAVQQRHGALALREALLRGPSSACWHMASCFGNGEAT